MKGLWQSIPAHYKNSEECDEKKKGIYLSTAKTMRHNLTPNNTKQQLESFCPNQDRER